MTDSISPKGGPVLGNPDDSRSLAEQSQEWKLSVCVAINAFWTDPGGALSFSTIILKPAGVDYVPPPMAGPQPVAGANQAENAFALSSHTLTVNNRAGWSKANGQALAHILLHVHPRLHPRIIGAIGGEDLFLDAPPRVVYNTINTICVATASDVTRAITSLDASFVYHNSESYHKHITTFRASTVIKIHPYYARQRTWCLLRSHHSPLPT